MRKLIVVLVMLTGLSRAWAEPESKNGECGCPKPIVSRPEKDYRQALLGEWEAPDGSRALVLQDKSGNQTLYLMGDQFPIVWDEEGPYFSAREIGLYGEFRPDENCFTLEDGCGISEVTYRRPR